MSTWKRRKLIRFIFLILALGLVCLQVFRWQDHAMEATWLSLKSGLFGLNFEDHLQFGSLCNSIENYKCSEVHFKEALHIQPNQLLALGNLAIARSHLKDDVLALKTFERYFEAGGIAYDVMFFYAQFLLDKNLDDKAVDWLYRSLSVHTSNQQVANQLVDQLILMERHFEALSLLGALSGGNSEEHSFWRLKIESLQEYLRTVANITHPDLLRLPTLDGKSYFVPVKYDSTSASWTYFQLDRSESDVIVSEELLSRWSYELYRKVKENGENLKKRNTFVLDRLLVGPWELTNVEASLCSKCQPRLGKSVFKYLEMDRGKDQIADFIILKQR